MNEQQNIQSETPVEYNTNLNSLNEYEKPKKNPTGGIIIAVLVLIIVGLGIYIAYDNGYLDKLIRKEEIPAGTPEPEKDIDVFKEKINKIDFAQLINSEFTNSEHPRIDYKIASILNYVFENGKTKDLTLNEYYEMKKCNDDYCKNYEVEPITIIDGETIKDYYKEFYGELPASHQYNSIINVGGYIYTDYDDGLKYYIIKYKQELNGTGIIGYPIAYDEVAKYNEEYTEDDDYYYLTFNYAIIRHIQEEHEGVYGEWYTETYNGMRDLLDTNILVEHPEKRNVTIDSEKSKELPRVKVYIKKGKNLYIEKIELLDEEKYERGNEVIKFEE